MTMTPTTLFRATGVAAALAGLIFIGVQINHPHLDATSITTTDVITRNSLKMLMAALALAGITGMYLRRTPRAWHPGNHRRRPRAAVRKAVRPSHRLRPRRPRLLPVARPARAGRSADPQPCQLAARRGRCQVTDAATRPADRPRHASPPKKVTLIACLRKLLTILNAMTRTNTIWQQTSQPKTVDSGDSCYRLPVALTPFIGAD
jgi:hypothetical protein